MTNEGWTLGELDGELASRGLSLGDVDLSGEAWMQHETPERAADALSKDNE